MVVPKSRLHSKQIPGNTTRGTNADLMVGQRRRRWLNIKTALAPGVVFDGMAELTICCSTDSCLLIQSPLRLR